MKCFRKNFAENIKTLFSKQLFPLKSCSILGNVEKYSKASQAADNNMTGATAFHAG